jgi:EmrB/QacA subfamily drug resistance transporter
MPRWPRSPDGPASTGGEGQGHPDDGRDDDAISAFTIDAPGVDEDVVVPWPLLLQRRAAGRARRSSRYAWIITATVLFGTFWVASTITILAVSRPQIADDLGASVESLVWLISGPTIALALTGTTAGKLGDLHGHRRVFLTGMSISTVFVLFSAVAWSGPSLIVFRVLAATAGAATGPSSLAIINGLFSKEDRSKALGFWSLVVAGGPVIGLVIGGPLVETVGWRMIFWAQAPLLALSALLAWFLIPDTPRRRGVHFDVRGQAVLFVLLGWLLFAIDRGAAWGFLSPWVLGALALSALSTWWFVRVEARQDHPLIPLAWFSRRGFAVPVFVSFFMQFGYMGGFTLTPKLLSEVRGLGADAISLMMIPRPLTFALAGPIAGMLAARISPRSAIVTGMASLAISMVLFAWISPDPVTWLVVTALTLSGIGVGASLPRVSASVANSVDDEDLGVAGATQQLLAQIGTTVGINLLETVQVAALGAAGLAGSYRVAYGVGAVVSVVGLVIAFGMRGDGTSPRVTR